MKKIIILLSIAVIGYSATYKGGLKLFKNKEYEKAYKTFDKILFKNLSSINLNYYLGRSAFEIGEYNEAIAAYERVLTINPKHHLARLELARTYYILGLYDQAQIEFQTVKGEKVPKEVKATVDKFLTSIKEKKRKYNWNGTASIGLKNDSNVFNSKDGAKSSMAHVENVAVISTYRHNNYTLKSGGGLYMENYTKESGASFLYPYAFAGPVFEEESYTIYLPVTVSDLEYNSEHILTMISLKADLSYKNTPEYLLKYKLKNFKSYAEFSKKFYKKDLNQMDSRTLKIGGNAKQNHEKGILTYDLSYTMERKERAGRTDIDHNLLEIKANLLSDKFHEKIILNLNGSLGLRFDNDKNIFEDKYRNDKTLKLGVTAVYPLDKKSAITGNIRYITNSSNIDAYNYNKTGVGVNYVYNFSDRELRGIYHKLGGEQ